MCGCRWLLGGRLLNFLRWQPAPSEKGPTKSPWSALLGRGACRLADLSQALPAMRATGSPALAELQSHAARLQAFFRC